MENWLSFPLSHAAVLMLGVASCVARCAHPVSPGTSYTPDVASFCFLKTCFQEGKKSFIFSLYLWFLILFNSWYKSRISPGSVSLTREELFLAFVRCRSDSQQILSHFVDLKKAFFHLRVGSRFLQISFFSGLKCCCGFHCFK